MKNRKIGDRFTLPDGTELVVEKSTLVCDGCYCRGMKCDKLSKFVGSCGGIIFKEIKNENRMKKSELKTGMWVTTRNGGRYLVIKDADTSSYGHQDIAFIHEEGFMVGSSYSENLKFTGDSSEGARAWDIVGVESYYGGFLCGETYKGRGLDVVWKETKAITLTLDELIEKAGYSKGEIIVKLDK